MKLKLFCVKDKNHKITADKGRSTYFDSRQAAKDCRDQLAKDKGQAFFVSRGPDHRDGASAKESYVVREPDLKT